MSHILSWASERDAQIQEVKNETASFLWSGSDCSMCCHLSWCSCGYLLLPNAVLSPQAWSVIRIPPLNLSAICRLNRASSSNNGSNYRCVRCSELKKNTLKMKNEITQELFWNNTGRNGWICMAINITITELTLFRARVWWVLFWKTLGSDKSWEHRRPGEYQNIIIRFGDTLLFFMACKNIPEIPAALRCRSACLWQTESAWGSIAKEVGNGSAWATW